MKGLFRKLVVGAILLSGAATSHALVIDPATGASGFDAWSGGLGSYVTFSDASTALSITLASYSGLQVTVDDCCVSGDEFGLVLDGVLTPWTSSGYVGGLFSGFGDLLLGPGAHTISFLVTADCCGSGGMSWSVSKAPEPGTLALFLAGLAGLGLSRRRIKH